jgi:Predicted metal-dependent hydrolase with the TIM-barrel fold
MKRNLFIALVALLTSLSCQVQENGVIMTVNGPISSDELGITLMHEHVLVDFAGVDSINSRRWDIDVVITRVLPYLSELKKYNCQAYIECTPSYLGKDPELLKRLSDASGMHILTNTGFYGAGNSRFIPPYAFIETADELANRWIAEWENGIGATGIKPGFIKIGVDPGSLSEIHQKLITSAAIAHLATGLVIMSHTGPSIPAFEQIAILRKEGVSPEAFIWTHAQSDKDLETHLKAARLGAWVALDGISDSNVDEYHMMIQNMKENNLLHRVLISHDAGWYKPAEENGGSYRGHTALFEKLLPLLRKNNFTEDEIHQLIVKNPSRAFEIKVRKNNL